MTESTTHATHFSEETISEIELLTLFSLTSTLEGIKIHHDADPARIRAGQSLHAKGFTTQPDGGYLTTLGIEAAEHAQAVVQLLQASSH
jgi:uncharacterized protein (TIGR02647 family)